MGDGRWRIETASPSVAHPPSPLAPFKELRMQIAMIGLGRMGGNMTERLLRNGLNYA